MFHLKKWAGRIWIDPSSNFIASTPARLNDITPLLKSSVFLSPPIYMLNSLENSITKTYRSTFVLIVCVLTTHNSMPRVS